MCVLSAQGTYRISRKLCILSERCGAFTKHLKRFGASACYNVSHFSHWLAFSGRFINSWAFSIADTILLYHIHGERASALVAFAHHSLVFFFGDMLYAVYVFCMFIRCTNGC